MNKIILITCLTLFSCANQPNLTSYIKIKETCDSCGRFASIVNNNCTECGASQGTRITAKRCVRCNGDEKITCTKCDGSGEITVKKKVTFSGSIGTNTSGGVEYSYEQETCPKCDGDRQITCPTCNGAGTIPGSY